MATSRLPRSTDSSCRPEQCHGSTAPSKLGERPAQPRRRPRGRPRGPRRGRRITGAVLVLSVLGLLLGACSTASSSGPTQSATPSSGAASATITIQNFSFMPATLTVRPRARVTVTNRDSVTHTLTSTTRVFNTGDIAPGQTVTFIAPSAPGKYPYLCLIHQYMTGTLIVS